MSTMLLRSRIARLLLLLPSLVGLWLVACGTVSITNGSVTSTVTSDVGDAGATQTVTAVAVATPSQTPPSTPSIEPTPTALTVSTVSYNGVSFSVDPILGSTVYTHDEQRESSSGTVVNYTRFTFAPDGLCREVGCVEVYPVAQYQEAFPDWPLPPVGAATILRAQDQPLSFQNGDGARSIRMRGQDIFFANNEDIVYDFQGYTDDGQYYVWVSVPIDAPVLLSTSDLEQNTNQAAIPVPTELPDDYAQLDILIQEYNQEAARQLDLLAATDFTPSLDVLDALVASLAIEAQPDSGPQPAPAATPPAAGSVGPFRLVTVLPPALSGDVVSLRVAPDGRLWVATTYGFAVWQDGRWQTYPPTDFRIKDFLPAPGGTIWLAHDQGVFIFDGVGWAGLSLSDIGMRPPLDPDNFTPYTLERVGNQDGYRTLPLPQMW